MGRIGRLVQRAPLANQLKVIGLIHCFVNFVGISMGFLCVSGDALVNTFVILFGECFVCKSFVLPSHEVLSVFCRLTAFGMVG